jgi:hypothetical protein
MDHLAALKLELIAKIIETTDEDLLHQIKQLLTTEGHYPAVKSNDTIAEEPVAQYMTEQDEREMLLNYIEHPAVAEKLRISREQIARGEVKDHDILHQQTLVWLNSL